MPFTPLTQEQYDALPGGTPSDTSAKEPSQNFNAMDYEQGRIYAQTPEAADSRSISQQSVDLLTKGLPLAIAGGLDTILQSTIGHLGLVDDQSMANAIGTVSTDYATYYKQHQTGLRAAGDVASTFAIVGAVSKLLRAPEILGDVAAKVTEGEAGAKAGLKWIPNFFKTSGKSVGDMLGPIEDQAMLLGRQRSLNYSADPIIKAATGQLKRTVLTDSLKVAAAINLSIYGAQNKSEFMFPSDMSALANATWMLAPDGLFAGAQYIHARGAVSSLLKSLGPEVAKMREMPGFPTEIVKSIIDRPGNRFYSAVTKADSTDQLKGMIGGVDKDTLANIRAEINANDKELYDPKIGIMAKMGSDNPYPGYSIKSELSIDQIASTRQMLESNTASGYNMKSLQELTPEASTKVPKAQQQVLSHLAEARQLNQIALVKATQDGDSKLIAELSAKAVTLESQMKEVHSATNWVIEPGGGLVPLTQRHPIAHDGNVQMFTVGGKEIPGNARRGIKYQAADGSVKTIGITPEGILVLPVPKVEGEGQKIVSGVNVTKTGLKIDDANSKKKLLLDDLAFLWYRRGTNGEGGPALGAYGKKVYDAMPPDMRQAIEDWSGSSRNSTIRKNPQLAGQIQQRYMDAGFHARLKELANPDGTITLFRGESKGETLSPTNDIVSMTPTPQVAAGFGEHIISRNVPIEDVIGPGAGLGAGREKEIIVKGNLNRVYGEVPVAQIVADTSKPLFESLDPMGRSVGYLLMGHQVNAWKPGISEPYNVFRGMHHSQLDQAIAMVDRHGPESIRMVGEKPYQSMDEMIYDALAGKADDYQKLEKLASGAKNGLLKLPEGLQLSIYDRQKMVNLPNNSASGLHPLAQLMGRLSSPDGITNFKEVFPNMAAVKNALKDMTGLPRTADLSPSFKWQGALISDIKSKPVVAIYSGTPEAALDAEKFKASALRYRATQVDKLQKIAASGSYVGMQLRHLLSIPDTVRAASQAQDMLEGMLSGKGIVLQSQFASRGIKPIEAAYAANDSTERLGLRMQNKLLEEPMGIFHKALAFDNKADLQSFANLHNSYLRGWDLEPGYVKLPTEAGKPELYGVQLSDTPRNRKIYREMMGKNFPTEEGQQVLMPMNETGMPAAVTALGRDLGATLTKMSHTVLDNINQLRAYREQPPINKLNHYFPVKNLAGKEPIYLANEQGKITHIVAGNNFNQSKALAEREIELAAAKGQKLSLMTSETASKYQDVLGELYGKMENYSNPRIITGHSAGKQATNVIESGDAMLKDMIGSITHQYQMLSRETMASFFEGELAFARHQAESAILPKGVLESRESVWDRYASTIYGKSNMTAKSSFGRFNFAAESLLDDKLRALWAHVNGDTKGYISSIQDKRKLAEYDSFKSQLGKYNPFNDAVDYANKVVGVPKDVSSRRIIGSINSYVTTMALRVLNTGMPVLNFASLLGVLPAVVHGMNRGAKEDVAAWRARVGAHASVVEPQFADTLGKLDGVEMANLKQVGPQQGSNPGGLFADKTSGEKWYVKFPGSEDHARNEALGARLYQAAGVDVPNVNLINSNGQVGVASKIIDGLTPDASGLLSKNVAGVNENFAVDAWLGNWDVVGLGYDNLLSKAGKGVRVDTGGTLRYRAQGQPKGAAFGNTVGEIETMLNPAKNPQAAAAFSKVTPDELKAGVAKVLSVRESTLRQALDEFGPTDPKIRENLFNTLRARQEDLRKRFPDAYRAPEQQTLGEPVPHFHPGRTIASAVHYMFTPEGRDIWREANNRGYLAYEVAERMHVLTNPTQGPIAAKATKLINQMSYLTDKSEYLTRGISFMTGYHMANKVLGLQKPEAMLWAHRVANATVGDYRPSNRAQMFQGVAGMPLGLFTTFLWNYGQRVFGDIEAGRWATVATQALVHQSLFGFQSFPGWQNYQDMFTANYDGTQNVSDRMDKNFGSHVTDAFMYGAPGAISKLFGEGISLQSRASLNFPTERFMDWHNLPAVSMIGTQLQGVAKIVNHTLNSGVDPRYTAEVISNYGVMAAAKQMANVGLGYSTTRSGEKVISDTRTGWELAARAMQVQTMREHEIRNEMYRNQQLLKTRQEHFQMLDEKLTSAIRAGKLTGDNPDVLNSILRDAVQMHMEPQSFKNFLAEKALKARGGDVVSKILLQAAKSSYNQGGAVRMIQLMDNKSYGDLAIDHQQPEVPANAQQ